MNEDKMELEEAKKTLKIIINSSDQPFKFAIETVLKELDNKEKEIQCLKAVKAMQEYRIEEMDIPKNKIEDKIKYYISKRDEYEESRHSCEFSIRMPALQGMDACINKIQVLQELLKEEK